ncbi:universal stress protein [Saccharopolyspora elongata]|nr:universal stress protein [Saccharopolyspora elongata]
MASTKERIVVGVDGSPESRAALRLRYGDKVGDEVGAVALWRVEPPFADKLTKPKEEYAAEARAALETTLAEVPQLSTACVLKPVLHRGVPADVLLDYARHTDLIVLDDKGRGPLAGLGLGSVVAEFLRHAPCPVVLVRPTESG